MIEVVPEHVVIAIYASHARAASALRALQGAGFDMQKWSLLGRDALAQAHAFGFYSARGHMRFWAGPDSVWRSVWSMLSGGGFFFLPALGPVVVMGPLVDWIVGALDTAPIGDEPTTALMRIGIADEDLARCALAVNAGSFLVLARGSAVLAGCARTVLARTGASQLDVAIQLHSEPVPLHT